MHKLNKKLNAFVYLADLELMLLIVCSIGLMNEIKHKNIRINNLD